MQIEQQLSDLTAAITENTAVLREILAAGGVTPSNVVAIPTLAEVKPAKKTAKAAPTPAPEPEPVVEETEVPTKVAAPAPKETEFSDPLDKGIEVVDPGTPEPAKIDVDATIAACVETFKAKMASADADRKTALKDAFPKLRSKWGLIGDAKLITLAPTPEKLVGLLGDIKAL